MVMNISAFYVKTFGADGSNFCAYDGFRVGHTIANTKVAGFFNPKARDLNAGDLIMCSCLDGNAMYVVAAKPSFDGNGTPINSLIIEDYSVVATMKQKVECECATTTNITLSGLQVIDGYTTLAGDRVLVKNQSLLQFNGIYLASATSWDRATDANLYSEFVYSSVYVESGGLNSNTGWIFTNADGGTIDVTPINVVKLSGSGATSNVGDYKKSAILTNHSGWLLCDGLAASRTVYASLFLVLGTAFGIGDGTTTFNLPDYRGRVGGSIGTGTGLTARTLGQKVGTETTILAIANLPAHTHGLLGDSASGIGSGESADRVLVNTDGQVRGVFVKNTEATGSGTAFSIMQPTLFGENTFIYAGS
jgi:microcystin-dependent protein